MSKETSARGEAKRQDIKNVLINLFLECAAHKESPEIFVKTINKHLGVIRGKMKPQENHFVLSALNMFKAEVREFKDHPYDKVLNLINVT